jgi:hypothetical protein
MLKSADPESGSGHMWYCLRLTAAQDTTQACHVHVADTEVLFTLHSNMLCLADAG